jgi:hypothetical protein
MLNRSTQHTTKAQQRITSLRKLFLHAPASYRLTRINSPCPQKFKANLFETKRPNQQLGQGALLWILVVFAAFRRPLMWGLAVFVCTTQLVFAGGGGQVTAAGQKVGLGGSTTCANINVSVNGSATVQIQMWYLFGNAPGGTWTVGGPGSQAIQLGNNVVIIGPAPPATQCGQPVSLFAVGVNGTFPVWVSFNP